MLDFLCEELKEALCHENLQTVYELRIRAGKPVMLNLGGKYLYLTHYGASEKSANAIVCSKEDIEEMVFAAGKYSVYSVEDQLRQGYITGECGERIGLAGKFIEERGKTLTVRDFSSLCIRVPHEIYGCAQTAYEKCFSKGVCNLLVASPPGLGKTTILRDLSRILCEKTRKNLLICDERGEISAGETGLTSDVFSFATKEIAFEAGIRAMRPDIIVTDELSENDCKYVKRAVVSGVKVIASAHFEKVEELYSPYLGLFEKYLFLDKNEIGKIRKIYDVDLREVYSC